MLVVYFLFADFRQDEFVDRLAEKAETTAKLLVEVKEIDYNMQKLIDKNSIRKLYKEKTQVFDGNLKLIYSSNDKIDVTWPPDELRKIKEERQVFRKTKQFDVLGLYYAFQHKDYYILISAEDTYGYRKLDYLRYLLLGAFITGTTLVWAMSFSLSKKSLKPLDDFRKQIQEITDNNLTIRLSKAKREDEINALAGSFNQMMDRIDRAYNRQREFTGHASHELRTPVARIAAQLENLLHTDELGTTIKNQLTSMAEDAFQLSEIISSLVALADINNQQNNISLTKVRLDEILFDAAAELSGTYPDFRLKFEIENITERDTDIEIRADETLLKIVVINLLKNAYLYSDNQAVESLIKQGDKFLQIIITNTGNVPNVDDTGILFDAFYRGSNVSNKPGSGVGLSIVKRIVQYHQAKISYHIIDQNTNQVVVTFLL